ncbi:MAG: acyl-ACP--UDP-N-acetylglucosamine O-acyltransferase [Chthoniobacterales bacterium]
MKIHPTAIVENEALIAEDVEVGPYAVIGREVQLGAGCVVQAHAVLTGRVIFGEKNKIGYGCVIGAPPQDFAFNESVISEVRIGSGNTFREYVTIHRGTKDGSATVIGNDNFLMTGCHAGHNVQIGNKTIIANNCLLAGYVEIGDGAVLGGGTVFHQFLRVGGYTMIRGGTRFGKDIPPYVAADGENLLSGINAVGMRRNGFSQASRSEVRQLFRLFFRSGLNMAQAQAEASENTWGAEATHFLDFIASSKRGVCKTLIRNGTDESEEAE